MAKLQDGVKRLCLVDDLKMLKITMSKYKFKEQAQSRNQRSLQHIHKRKSKGRAKDQKIKHSRGDSSTPSGIPLRCCDFEGVTDWYQSTGYRELGRGDRYSHVIRDPASSRLLIYVYILAWGPLSLGLWTYFQTPGARSKVAAGQPDYVPGPEEPEQGPLSPDYPYAVADSPIALSPGYVADSGSEEDPRQDLRMVQLTIQLMEMVTTMMMTHSDV
ncbi:hypothetical protein Tco_0855869 [Tanacetum coccineum]